MAAFRTTIVVLVFLGAFLFFGTEKAFSYEYDDEEEYYRTPSMGGPVPIRNQMPLYLFYLQMIPDRASVVGKDKFVLDADYTVSNITVSAFTPTSDIEVTPQYDIQIDAEVSRVTLDFRYGIYDNLEIGLELPYISLSSGYLDSAIEGFEDGIGARTPRSRERQGSYNLDYTFQYRGEYLIYEKDHLEGLGDIILNAKYQLLKESGWFWPNISLRSAIKFPTAKEDQLLGSGEFDYGFGFLIDKGFFERVFLCMGGNVVAIEKPSVLSILDIDEYIYGYMLAIEGFLSRNFSIVVQASGHTTPYPGSGTNPLDNDAHDFALGFNYRWKEKTNVSWNFAIVENISAASSPDVSFNTSLNWEF